MSEKKIIIITGSDLRHQYLACYLSNQAGIYVQRTFMEGTQGDLNAIVNAQTTANTNRSRHLVAREESEIDFFKHYCSLAHSNLNSILIQRNSINNSEYFEQIKLLSPDLIITYGCSILRGPLLTSFKGRIINIHLGLSPYYRGAGTNFWPFVNRELQLVGVTFMYIDEGIDTGEVIHQIRPRIYIGDSIHTIGNRLIKDMVTTCASLINNFDRLNPMPQVQIPTENCRYYKKAHFTEASVEVAYKQLSSGLVDEYLDHKEVLEAKYPIVSNPDIQ